MRAWAFGLLVGVACGAAGPRPGSPPEATVRSWNDASRQGDAHTAYALLTDDVKKHVSYSEFATRWKAARIERERQSASIEASLHDDSVVESAKLSFGDGKTTMLQREEDGWKLDVPLLSSQRAQSPQDALRVLAAALESRSVDGLLRIVTKRRREGLVETIDAFLSGLRGHTGDEISVEGDRAVLHWKDGKRRWKIVFQREDGEWRIDDFDFQFE